MAPHLRFFNTKEDANDSLLARNAAEVWPADEDSFMKTLTPQPS